MDRRTFSARSAVAASSISLARSFAGASEWSAFWHQSMIAKAKAKVAARRP